MRVISGGVRVVSGQSVNSTTGLASVVANIAILLAASAARTYPNVPVRNRLMQRERCKLHLHLFLKQIFLWAIVGEQWG